MSRHLFARRQGLVCLGLVILLFFGWVTSPQAAPVSAGPATVPAKLSADDNVIPVATTLPPFATDASTPRTCVSPISGPAPTPSPTAPATAIATPTPIPTPTVQSGVPTPTAVTLPNERPLPPLPSNCLVSLSPPESFNALGRPHTVYFLCGASDLSLPGPAAAPQSSPGCYDVAFSVSDATNGATVPIDSLQCGGVASTDSNASSCTGGGAIICPVGDAHTASNNSGVCAPAPCPSAFTYMAADTQCHAQPVGGVCPAGATSVENSSGAVIDCTEPPIPPHPTEQNVAIAQFNPGAPHDYLITVTGFVATTGGGACPSGTNPVSSVALPTGSGAIVSGPACRFSLTVEKKYIEGTNLQIFPLGQCGEYTPTDISASFGDTPCFFEIKATGMVVLKQGVVCSDGQEPASGTPAPYYGVGSQYQCDNGTLRVVNVPVPFVNIDLSATNGVFNPACIPQSQKPVLTPVPTGTITPSPSPTATNTPVVTDTPTPTATALPPGVTPQPVQGTSGPSFCAPPGTGATTVLTDQNGIAGAVGTQIAYRVQALPQSPASNTYVNIVGEFLVDGVGVPNVQQAAALEFKEGTEFCDSGTTNTQGVAVCSQYVDSLSPGFQVNVPVSFVYNCQEYDTATSFTPSGGSPTPTPGAASQPPFQLAPAPNGICVLRSGAGPLTVTATYTSTINTQPALTTGPVTLGVFSNNTPTPTSSPSPIPPPTTPTPSPTNTVVPTIGPITATPIPSETPTATPTITPTPLPTMTPVPTATLVHTLRFKLNAARVAKEHSKPNGQGLPAVSQGQRVWLIMYYTINDLPKKLSRTTTYEIRDSAGHDVFRAPFTTTVGPPPADLGSVGRYITYTVPSTLPFGLYEFRATLKIGPRSQSRVWRFAVLRTIGTIRLERMVVHGGDTAERLQLGMGVFWRETRSAGVDRGLAAHRRR